MKKLLTLLLFSLSLSVSAQTTVPNCSTSVLLLRDQILSNLIVVNNLQGVRCIRTKLCCAPLFGDNLIITEDTANGVTVTANGLMKILNYNGADIEWCAGDTESYTDKAYWFSSSAWFPYHFNSQTGHIDTIANADQREVLDQYGWPDTMIAYSAPLTHVEPYDDRRIGIQLGRMDCYYDDFPIGDKPPGTYEITIEVNFPPSVYDYAIYPHEFTFIAYLNGYTIYPVSAMDECCPYAWPANPPTGCTASQGPGHGAPVSISFDEVQGMDSVIFQAWRATGQFAGMSAGPQIKKAVSELFYDATLHRYKYTYDPDFPKGNYRWYIRAHNCVGWGNEAVTNPKLNVN